MKKSANKKTPAALTSVDECLEPQQVSPLDISVYHVGRPPRKKKKEVFRKMTKIEKMKKYIERTKLGKDRRFCMDYLEGRELLDAIHSSPSQLEIILSLIPI